MKFYVLLAVLPYAWGFNEASNYILSNIHCPDNYVCPIGKTCCEVSGHYNCCDIAEIEIGNKKLIPGHPSNNTKDLPDLDVNINANCSKGQFCFNTTWCCEYKEGTCCANSTSCCPKDYKCCGNASSDVWCCKTKQRCAETYLYCIAGASSLSSAFLSVAIMLIIAISLKNI